MSSISLTSTLEELVDNIRVRDSGKATAGYHGGIDGGACYFLSPAESDYTLEGIVRTLARTPRWGGRVAPGYEWTVLDHSELVAALVRDTGGTEHEQKLAFMHDFAEAFLGDVPTPLKRLLGDNYKRLETLWAADIGYRAGVGVELVHLPEIVKRADILALEIERRAVLVNRPESFKLWGAQELSAELNERVEAVRLYARLQNREYHPTVDEMVDAAKELLPNFINGPVL